MLTTRTSPPTRMSLSGLARPGTSETTWPVRLQQLVNRAVDDLSSQQSADYYAEGDAAVSHGFVVAVDPVDPADRGELVDRYGAPGDCRFDGLRRAQCRNNVDREAVKA